jgi:hypothetical protein
MVPRTPDDDDERQDANVQRSTNTNEAITEQVSRKRNTNEAIAQQPSRKNNHQERLFVRER